MVRQLVKTHKTSGIVNDANRYESEGDKRFIGQVWAEASGGKCLFCMPTAKDYGLIDRTISGRG